MQEDRPLFTPAEEIAGDQPMIETKFWAFLKENKDIDEVNRYIDALCLFLGKQGFVRGHHRLSEEQVTNHKHVFSHFWWRNLRGFDI